MTHDSDGDALTRRGFVTSAIATGFALAVQPVSAQTLQAEATGLIAGEVQIPAEGGMMPGYRAMPEKGSNFPVVLVVHEIFGVHEHIQTICRRLAKQGYLAVAPDLFARFGDMSKQPNIEAILPVVAKVPDAYVMSDLDKTAAWANATGKANGAKVAVTGFCWGGRIVWLYAAHNPAIKAGAAWYGRLVSPTTPLQPRSPVDIAAELKAPVLGLYGGKDDGIPPDAVAKMRDALKAAKKPSEIVVFPEAKHGFNADYRPSYDEKAAKEAWGKMLAWFKKNGVA